MKLRYFTLLALGLVLGVELVSAQKVSPDDFLKQRFTEVEITEGVKYADAKDYKGASIPLSLDLYRPKGDKATSRPLIIWIHGGGFRLDSKRTQNYVVKYATAFAKHGFVCASIDYRLRDGNDMKPKEKELPALQDASRDAQTALDWLKAHIKDYGIDPNAIFVAGGSAGGRTAFTLAYHEERRADRTVDSPDTNEQTVWNKAGIVAAGILWGAPEPWMKWYALPSAKIPTILIHGTADTTIPYENSKNLFDALISAGITAELHPIQDAAHTPVGDKTDPQIEEWLTKFFVQEWKKKTGSKSPVNTNSNPPKEDRKRPEIYKQGWIDFNKNGKKDIFEDPAMPVEKRLDDLLSQMTLEEKSNQLATLYGFGRVLKDELPTPDWKNKIWKDGIGNIDEHLNETAWRPQTNTQYAFPYSKHAEAINTVQRWFIEETRLGIPVDFTNEGLRGLTHKKATSFPSQINTGSTWDKPLIRKIGQVVGREARALGYTNVYSPILDIASDPRWGRTVESYGEEPYLVSMLGKEMILGLQEEHTVSTLKHFAVYSVPKGGRDGNARTDPHIAFREMQELYLMPFRVGVRDAGALGVMSSYNDYDGVPITASHYFLTELLRDEWKFKGYVVSDSSAVEFIANKHHVAKDYKEAVRQVVEAGLNIRTAFQPPDEYILPIRELVKEGKLSEKVVDQRVREVLRVKFWIGLFDKPYVDAKKADEIVRSKDALDASLQASRESLVLLKNANNTLPLDRSKIKSIFVTGPNATEVNHSISRYGPSGIDVISVLDGIKKQVGNSIDVKYAKGCDMVDSRFPESEIMPELPNAAEQKMIDEAVSMAKDADVSVVVLGEDNEIVGEGRSRTGLDLPGHQLDLLKAIQATGKPVILVLLNGRPLTINWADRHIPAIIEAWFPGEFGGQAVAETLFGDYNPGGKLTFTFPKSIGQLPFNFPFKPGSQANETVNKQTGLAKAQIQGALYPFGFGLSYTRFEYSNLKVSPEKQKRDGKITIDVDVKNIGSRDGDEVVQLYINDKVSSVTTYEKNLRGFERVNLKSGETKTITFMVTPEDLQILDLKMKWTVEPGEFEVQIGSSSEDIRLKKTFEIIQ